MGIINHKLALTVGTCHLPLRGLNQVLLQLLTFNTLWKEFRMERRNEALCAWGKTIRAGLQIDMFRNWFYESNSCISSYLEKHRNPSWWWLFLMTSKSFTRPAETFRKNMCLIFACTLSSPKSHVYYSPPYLFEAVSQNYLRCYLQGCPGGGHDNPLLYSCWIIPWTEEPGWLQSRVSQRVRHDWAI